jgi:hypothetical protein
MSDEKDESQQADQDKPAPAVEADQQVDPKYPNIVIEKAGDCSGFVMMFGGFPPPNRG